MAYKINGTEVLLRLNADCEMIVKSLGGDDENGYVIRLTLGAYQHAIRLTPSGRICTVVESKRVE